MTPARLRVLTYHRIQADTTLMCSPSTVSATREEFTRQMRHVARRYRAVSADQVADALSGGTALPPRAVLVTFDDGCRDFGEVAWPILRRYRVPATVFVPTAYPGRPRAAFWWDRLHAALEATSATRLHDPCTGRRLHLGDADARARTLRYLQNVLKTLPHARAMRMIERLCRDLEEVEPPPNDVLSWEELRALAADGVAIGAHTHTHPALTRLPLGAARDEIVRSRDEVQHHLGASPRLFSYPFGDHDDAVVALVREAGFAAAVTCVDGHNHVPGTDALRLRRTNITGRTNGLLFGARLTAAGASVDAWRHRRRAPLPASPVTPVESSPLKVAYVMSRFPKLSETFVLNEMAALAALGVDVTPYPLLRARQRVQHAEAAAWAARARFMPFLSLPIARAHAHFLAKAPRSYAGVLKEVTAGTWGSMNFFVGALGVFPKAVRFAYEMEREGVDHVHAHFATHPAVAALVVHRLTGIPFSFTAHGSDLHVDRRMLDVKVAAASFAVTISEFNKRVMSAAAGVLAARKIHVVHCGVDPATFEPAPDRADGPVQLICVASLEEVKGHRFLIEACRLLHARGVDFRCHLVGDGPQRQDLEARIVRAGLASHVLLHGPRPRHDVVRLLAHSDIAVLASHPTREGKREGIPVALMEAMAAGLPVVATAISGIPELVLPDHTGLLVPSGDPEALAMALARLAGDPSLRRHLGHASRQHVIEHFNLRRSAEQMLALFVRARGGERQRSGLPLALLPSESR